MLVLFTYDLAAVTPAALCHSCMGAVLQIHKRVRNSIAACSKCEPRRMTCWLGMAQASLMCHTQYINRPLPVQLPKLKDAPTKKNKREREAMVYEAMDGFCNDNVFTDYTGACLRDATTVTSEHDRLIIVRASGLISSPICRR